MAVGIFCAQCNAPLMTIAEEIDRVANLYAARKDDGPWAVKACARLVEMGSQPRMSLGNAPLCYVCAELFGTIGNRPYWQRLEADAIRIRRRRLTGE